MSKAGNHWKNIGEGTLTSPQPLGARQVAVVDFFTGEIYLTWQVGDENPLPYPLTSRIHIYPTKTKRLYIYNIIQKTKFKEDYKRWIQEKHLEDLAYGSSIYSTDEFSIR